MSLFREEVSRHRRERLHGQVVLTQPMSTRYAAYAIFLVIGLAITWMTVGTYARIETVPGILTTTEPSAKVIAPIPGVVADLHVGEGDIVEKGQALAVIRLDRPAVDGSDLGARGLRALETQRLLAQRQVGLSMGRAEAEKTRLAAAAEASDQQAADLMRQAGLQREVVQSNQLLFDRIADVVEKGFVSQVEFERRRQLLLGARQTLGALEQQAATKRAEAQQARAQMTGLDLEAAQSVSDIQSSVESITQQEARLQGEQAYVITAPVAGRVTALQTGQGRTTAPNMPMMVIVPDASELRAELYAPTRAIGFVAEGQETRILYDAFPYQRFGSFGGRIESISRAVIDPRETEVPIRLEEPVYRIEVALDPASLKAQGGEVPLQAGMTLQANIILERQTFLAWLLKPLYAVLRRDS